MFKKILKYLLISILGFILITLIVLSAPAMWHRWVIYPRLEKQVNKFSKLWKEPPVLAQLNTYRGVMHVHSYWSHDSEGTLYDIIPAAKNAGIEFIFLTDHPRDNIDTFPRGYKGYYEGILIEPGSEKQGFDAWPLDSAIIDWSTDKDTLVKKIVNAGGIIFYAHTEEPHNWANPWYQGMEIYNFHTDTKDESLLPQIINFIVNGKKYRHWAYREMFDEQTSILALWDSLNTQRKIVGFSAVDTHENQNIRARYIEDGRVEWVGPDANIIDTMQVKFWNRWLFHSPDTNGWIFKWMIDTYKEGFNHITNYVFADTLSVPSLAYHLKKGHLFTAFKSLGDATGFILYSQNSGDSISGITGDSVNIEQVKTLRAISPLPGQFRLILDGKTIDISPDENYEYSWSGLKEKGAYRIEIHIKLKRKLIPWIYSNPIYIF
ncbi:MAG: PHP domain-containing protein [Bacteroidales bacterium]|nr:PHP domain-containing protein [Bacteroidales bacterium]